MSNRKKIKSPQARIPGGKADQRDRAGLRPTVSVIDELTGLSFRYNGYICEKCDKGWLTIDIDSGTTPRFSPCFATQGCDGRAHSMGYPEGEPPEHLGSPIIQWYKPTEMEFAKLDPALQEHVRRGGLVRRATQEAPDWVKAIA